MTQKGYIVEVHQEKTGCPGLINTEYFEIVMNKISLSLQAVKQWTLADLDEAHDYSSWASPRSGKNIVEQPAGENSKTKYDLFPYPKDAKIRKLIHPNTAWNSKFTIPN